MRLPLPQPRRSTPLASAKPGIARRWVPLLVSLLCSPLRAAEFGGVADPPPPPHATEIFESILAPQWRERGWLTWIRRSSPLLTARGINQVSILEHQLRKLAPAGQDLPDDLLELYWQCRKRLPVYPEVRQAWEVWNEPDFYFVRDNADQMAAVLKAAYWGIKAGNPRAIVLMPSLAFNPGKYGLEFARNNALAFTDGYNFHYYGWAQDFLPSAAAHREFLDHHRLSLPLWVTEAGYFQMSVADATRPDELARQQAFHERLAISAHAAGIDYYLPFILTPYTEAGSDLSLVTPDWAPRPALDSYLLLSRLLPSTKPIYQIHHTPTQTEIGVVLAQADGDWWTILWSPHRWKDSPLPSSSSPPRSAQSASPEHAAALDLELNVGELPVQMGLEPSMPLKNLGVAHVRVSAGRNIHLRAPPRPFPIRDCVWMPVPTALLPGPGLAAPNASPAAAARPSPVVLRLQFPPLEVASHKPSQTYRFQIGRPITATLHVYNFSETTRQGRVDGALPAGWKVNYVIGPAATSAGSPFPLRLSVPPLGRISLAIQLEAMAPARSIQSRGRSPRASSNPLSAGQPKFHPGNRRLLTFEWEETHGVTDRCAVWLEPSLPFLDIPKPFSGGQWHCPPDRPEEWSPLPQTATNGVWRFQLRQPPPAGRFASLFFQAPERTVLRPTDLLSLEVRRSPRSGPGRTYYRLNLLTDDGQSFRYTEDLELTDTWQPIHWLIQDFGPTFWSRAGSGKTQTPPADAIRWLRLSVDHLQPGEVVELRHLGLTRF